MCPVLFKGSRSLLLLACCYVTYRRSCAYLYRRYLFVWQPCCNSLMGTALFVRLSVCGSIYVYRCRALLVTGCTCIYAYNLAKGPSSLALPRIVHHQWLAAPDVIWHIYSRVVLGMDLLSAGDMALTLMSSTGVSKCAKSCPELPAIDDALSWAGQGWKDPCLNSSPEKLHPGRSARNSQGTFPMVRAAN